MRARQAASAAVGPDRPLQLSLRRFHGGIEGSNRGQIAVKSRSAAGCAMDRELLFLMARMGSEALWDIARRFVLEHRSNGGQSEAARWSGGDGAAAQESNGDGASVMRALYAHFRLFCGQLGRSCVCACARVGVCARGCVGACAMLSHSLTHSLTLYLSLSLSLSRYKHKYV